MRAKIENKSEGDALVVGLRLHPSLFKVVQFHDLKSYQVDELAIAAYDREPYFFARTRPAAAVCLSAHSFGSFGQASHEDGHQCLVREPIGAL